MKYNVRVCSKVGKIKHLRNTVSVSAMNSCPLCEIAPIHAPAPCSRPPAASRIPDVMWTVSRQSRLSSHKAHRTFIAHTAVEQGKDTLLEASSFTIHPRPSSHIGKYSANKRFGEDIARRGVRNEPQVGVWRGRRHILLCFFCAPQQQWAVSVSRSLIVTVILQPGFGELPELCFFCLSFQFFLVGQSDARGRLDLRCCIK